MSRQLTPAEARRALNSLTGLAKAEAVGVLNDTAEKITKGAQRRAPVRTGRLKSAIDTGKATVKQKRPTAKSGVRTTRGGESGGDVFEGDKQDAYYWKFVEYGTTRTAAKPMFRPAAVEQERTHMRKMERALESAAKTMERQA